ncbi:MAG: hypothetical protein HYY61_06165 [Deltaproteobacteria bacterium]|nr:hypothetical protein [Deltaproteobacteria bacterium]
MVSNNRIETKIRKIVREELKPIREELKLCAKKEDLEKFATKEELGRFATKEELKNFPTREEVRQMIHDGVDIIRVLIEGYRSDFRISIDGYKGLDGRVGSLEHRVDRLEKQV